MAVTEGSVTVPGTSDLLDTVVVTTGEGAVHREMVSVGHPEFPSRRVLTHPGGFNPVLNLPLEFVAHHYGEIDELTANVYTILGSRDLGWTGTAALGDACSYLDTSQNGANVPTSGQTLYLYSSSANDTGAGTGVRTVRTVYLDAVGEQQVRTDTLNGSTAVSIGTGYTAIQWMESATVGSGGIAAGNISISSTNGAPTVATTFERIATGGNRSMSGNYKVPSNAVAYVCHWSSQAISNTMDCRLRISAFSDDNALSAGVFHFVGRMFLSSGSEADRDLHYAPAPAGATIKVSAIPGAAGAGNRLDTTFNVLVLTTP